MYHLAKAISMAAALVGVLGCGQRDGRNSLGHTPASNDLLDATHAEYSEWALLDDSSSSVGLHFNLGEQRDTVSIRFTNECWLELPIRRTDDTTVLLWVPALDTKYDFDFAKAINAHPPSDPPAPFMTLLRTADSTLRVLQVDTTIAQSINLTKPQGEIPWIPDSFGLIYRN